jgi:hypothetical protein
VLSFHLAIAARYPLYDYVGLRIPMDASNWRCGVSARPWSRRGRSPSQASSPSSRRGGRRAGRPVRAGHTVTLFLAEALDLFCRVENHEWKGLYRARSECSFSLVFFPFLFIRRTSSYRDRT